MDNINTSEVETTETTEITNESKPVSWEEKYGKKGRNGKKKKGKPAIIIGIVVVVLALIGAAVYGFSKFMKKTTDSLGQETLVEEYKEQDMTTYINSTGVVASREVQSVVSTLQYPIKEIKVQVGDRVKAGDTVCIIDDKDINQKIDALEAQASDEDRRQAKELEIADRQLSQAYNSSARTVSRAEDKIDDAQEAYEDAKDDYEKAEKAYKNAQKKLKKAKKATDTDALKKKTDAATTAKKVMDAAEITMTEKQAAYEAAKDGYDQTVDGQIDAIESAENSNEITHSNVSTYSAIATELANYYDLKAKTIIKAEHDGIVTEVKATEGLVPSGIILQIENDNNLSVTVDIKERDIFKMKEGLPAEISSGSIEDVTGTGKVSKVIDFVSGEAETDQLSSMQGSKSSDQYKAVIDIDSFEKLLLGMKIKVKIATGNEIKVLAVPYTAIMTDEDDDKEYVYIAKDQGSGLYMAVRKDIETGESGDYYTEIVGGDLEPGDKVICYPDKVFEGSIVKITE